MFSWNHKSRMLCDVSISNIKPPIFPNYKPTHYQVPGVMKRGISRAIYSTKAKLSPSTEVLYRIFSKGNGTVISTSSGKHRHVVVEASGTTVVAICRRGAEIINTFCFSEISAFSPRYIAFTKNTSTVKFSPNTLYTSTTGRVHTIHHYYVACTYNTPLLRDVYVQYTTTT